MFVSTAYRAMLQRSGLVRFADFCGSEGEVISAHGSRDVVKLALTAEDGPHTVYLKRFGPTHLKDALKDLLRLRRVRTKALVEFTMLCALRDVDVAVPNAIACGERHVLGRDRASFIMIDALPAGRPLDEVLTDVDEPTRRRRLIASAAAFVRRMHDAGFTHTDLFAKHLFVAEAADDAWSVSVIDLQRGRLEASASRKRRGRDLAALMVSLEPDAMTLRERRMFLLGYLDADRLTADDLRFVRNVVLPRARKLSRRGVYRAWQPLLERT